MSNIFPLEINLERNKKVLNIVFSNDKTYSLSAELLRVESPSAEVQGHGVEKILILNKELIQIENIESVGNYAIRIIFSDGHNSGYYTWEKLYEFSINHDKLMKDYKKQIKKFTR